jgi:hypothetical protein
MPDEGMKLTSVIKISFEWKGNESKYGKSLSKMRNKLALIQSILTTVNVTLILGI